MADQSIPLILCMESVNGEEVALTVEPDDDFQKFLDNARSLLGYDIDLNSITKDQPVVLTDNAYQYLLNAENSLANDQLLAEGMGKNDDDLVYILDDGTQINASQIHFDNEDPLIDLTAEKIPFVKYVDDGIDYDLVAPVEEVTKKIDIVESPVSRWSRTSSPKRSFANSLPFRLVGSGGSGFDAHFAKYLENISYSNHNSIARNNSALTGDSLDQKVRKDDGTFTREDILNMFKDPPAATTNNNTNFIEKRRHVRKTDPSRPGHRNWHSKPISYIDVDGTIIAQSENQDCFVCGTYVDNNSEKLYLFDNEDQRLHRSSPQKRLSTQLKIICEACLNENFKPCRLKSPNQSLNPDEYLVIRKNQQYIFQKTKNFNAQNSLLEAKAIIDKVESKLKGPKDMEFVKVEIGSDGEIVTKSIDNDSGSDVVIVQDEKKRDRSSDVEIVEDDIDDSIIDNLDDADEHVKEFLGKYQSNGNDGIDLKCRFCEIVFEDLSQVIEHGEIHKHETDDDKVYPCPLCDYGYANFKWLKGHLKAAHDKVKVTKDSEKLDDGDTKESPIAKRTRSCNKKGDECKETASEENSEIKDNTGPLNLIIKTEVKQECLDESDDDGIWIVQTAEDEPTHSLTEDNNGGGGEYKRAEKCSNCSQIIIARDTPEGHRCRRSNKKRKPYCKENKSTPTSDDLTKKIKKKKRPETSSDPLIVTCDDCNESFTSKVRLKFHMQFHDRTSMRGDDGRYRCCECKETTFETETQLFDHVHFQHQKQRMWQCPVERCGKSFYLRATLTKHSRTHTDTRRYVCVSCGKRFLDKQTLDEHGVTHLQIKPFQCHICMKQLTRRSRLRMHVRAHDTPPRAALLLACALCSRAFTDRAQAEEHALKSKCIETFAEGLKVENDEPSVQLSPTSGVVRRAAPLQASGVGDRAVCVGRAAPLLAGLSAAAANPCGLMRRNVLTMSEYMQYLPRVGVGDRAVCVGRAAPLLAGLSAAAANPCGLMRRNVLTMSEYMQYLPRVGVGDRAVCVGRAAPLLAGLSAAAANPCGLMRRNVLTMSEYMQYLPRVGVGDRAVCVGRAAPLLAGLSAAAANPCGLMRRNVLTMSEYMQYLPRVGVGDRAVCVGRAAPLLAGLSAAAANPCGLMRRNVLTMSEYMQYLPRVGVGDRAVCVGRAAPLLAGLSAAAASIVRVVEIDIAYRCEYCEDVFYSEVGLNTHRQIHKGVKNPFTCHICKVSFATYSRCTTHKTTHGFYKRSLEDAKKLAGKSSDEGSNIAKGILGYGGFPVVKHFLCEDCGRSYLHWTYLQVHRRMKHNNEKVTHRCNSCDLTFPNSWSLAYHKKKVHVNAAQADVSAAAKPSKGDHRIPCRDCDELLPNKTALYKHRKKEHSDLSLVINNKTDESWNPNGINLQGTINSQTPQKQDVDPSSCAANDAFRNNNQKQSTKTFTCSQCGDVFRTACTLSTHMRTHANERSRPCHDCGMDYTRAPRQVGSSCPRCSGVKRYGVRTPFGGRSRHRQVTSLYVIEVDGLNPNKDCIKKYLDANNIQHDKVLDINMISYAKGTTGIVPDSVHSLSLMSHVPRLEVPWSRSDNVETAAEEFIPALQTGAGAPRRPKILQRAGNNYADGNGQLDTNAEDLTELNLQMLLDEGVLVNGNRMVRLELEDDVSNDNDMYSLA